MTSKLENLPYHIGHSTLLYGDKGTYQAYSAQGFKALHASQSGRHGYFHSYKVIEDGGYLNGYAENYATWDEWPFLWRYTGEYPYNYRLDPISVPSVEYLSTQLYAGSNPSKPAFDVLRAIGELKDLPDMLHGIGESFLHKGYANAFGHLNLSYRFGWAPFIKDIVALVTCQELVDKRFKQLRALAKHGTELKKQNLFDQKVSSDFEGQNGYFKCRTTVELEEKIWGYAIWKTDDLYPKTDQALLQLARRCALGLSARPKQAWDLLPWTWLIDWFINVGDLLQAHDNTAHCYVDVACICHTSINNWRSVPLGSPSDKTVHASLSPQKHLAERHVRYGAAPPTLTAQMPMLDAGQLGILGSIKATRR